MPYYICLELPFNETLPEIKSSWKPEEGRLLAFIPVWGPRFTVDFKFRINEYPSRKDSVANIIHFTAGKLVLVQVFKILNLFKGPKECCDMGERIPAFSINNRDFEVAMGIGDEGNKLMLVNVKSRKWYSIGIIQDIVEGQVIIPGRLQASTEIYIFINGR